jgi:glycosyltransferase involved in cell wall biosynthesis
MRLGFLRKNKKILIITECFFPEEFKINDVALSWKEKGYDVDVLTLIPTYPLGKVYPCYKNGFLKKDEYKGINIFRMHAVTGYKNSIIKKIFKYINFMLFGSVIAIFIGKRYDYIFGFNLGSLTDMLPAIVISKLYKKPTMFWVQDVWPDSVYAYGFKKTKILSTFLDSFVKFMYHNVTAIAISSKGFESKLEPYVNKRLKFTYAPNWADDLNMNISPIILSTSQKVHFTFAGNVGKVQNLENIISAFSLLSDEYQNKSQFNIIGDGSHLTILKKISNDNPNIIFHGKQMRENMVKFYKASDFLIVSLIDKSIFSVTVPAKTQTYIAAKKPILAIINGDVADIVNDNNLGISVNPSKVCFIKEAFEKCIDMPENEKSKFIINNVKLMETTFNKVHIINQLTSQLVGCDD